jgi:apolipoprotein N-acyltransferase
MHRLGCNMEVRIAFLAIAIWAIWLATDQILATKYWYALALDPAPLWLARVAGEEGLAAAMIGTSAALAWASRQTHGYRVLAWGGVTGMGGWLCLGNPLTDEPRSWPGIDVLAIQPGIHDSASSRDQTEALQLLTGMSTAHGRGLTPGLILLPELMAIPLDDGSPYLSPYLMASRRYRADILINGARPVGAAVFERSASLVVDGALQSDSVPKRRLIPHYESLRGPQGSRWVAGNGDAPRMLNSANGRIAPLLCFEIFDRSALRGLQANSALVAVAADTSSFGHPALSRYVVHAAAFQSQAARAPVVLTNYSGPSAVVFPNGERHKVLERGATGYFRISPGGDVEMQEFRLWKPP